MKKQLSKSIQNSKQDKNKSLQDAAEKVQRNDKVAEVIEYIIKRKNRNIIWLAYQQSKGFERLITFFSIAYLQPAISHRNFINDVTNVWLSFFSIVY